MKFEAGHEKSRLAFISFIIFILKTTSMYFDLIYYYYTNSYYYYCYIIQTFVRFSKLLLPLVWEWFCWSIPSFSFLSCIRIFYIFSFITHSRCVLNMKIFQFCNRFICTSPVTAFSMEQNKLSLLSTVLWFTIEQLSTIE